jgi:hypothetical protein
LGCAIMGLARQPGGLRCAIMGLARRIVGVVHANPMIDG